MKKLMPTALVLLMMASTASSALAQDGHGRGQHGDRGQNSDGGRGQRDVSRQGGRDAAPTPAAPAAATPAPAPAPARAARGEHRGPSTQPARQGVEGRGWNRGAPAQRATPVAPTARQSSRDGQRGSADWSRGRQNPGADRGQLNDRRDDRNDGQRWRGGDDNRGPDQRNDRRGDDRRWDGRNDNRGGYDRNDNRRWDGRNDNRQRPRYDRRAYPSIFRSHQRFRIGAYRAPYGYYNRSWGYGDILPRAWFGQQYFLNDWYDYGLPTPPLGYDWVRVGDDALLIDSYSGRVVQVAYDIFW